EHVGARRLDPVEDFASRPCRRHAGACGLEDFADQRQRVDGTVDRKSTRLNSSHLVISYAVFCLKKKKKKKITKLEKYNNLIIPFQIRDKYRQIYMMYNFSLLYDNNSHVVIYIVIQPVISYNLLF